MHLSVTMELIAIVLTFVVHVIGGVVLIYTLMDRDEHGDKPGWRDWWPRDDDGPTPPTEPVPTGGGDALPYLPDAVPASSRMREGERLGDRRARPARRPAHPPVEPQRAPDRV